MTDHSHDENVDDQRISKLDGCSINSELQKILDEQKLIAQAFTQPFPSRVISCTDTELELELAAIALSEHTNDHFEQIPVTPAVTDQNNT